MLYILRSDGGEPERAIHQPRVHSHPGLENVSNDYSLYSVLDKLSKLDVPVVRLLKKAGYTHTLVANPNDTSRGLQLYG